MHPKKTIDTLLAAWVLEGLEFQLLLHLQFIVLILSWANDKISLYSCHSGENYILQAQQE